MVLAFSAQAKRFANQFIEFELPSGWKCVLEGQEWVCQNTNKERKKEAIIIMAAKIRGPQDSLEQYQAYLKQSKTFTLPGGKTQVSEPKYTKISTIKDQRWIDALHLASEVPGFYTRYLATTKEDLGVAITFSVGKDFYEAYQPIFDRVIKTLKVFRQKQAQLADTQLKRSEEDLIAGNTTYIPDDEVLDIGNNQKRKRRKSSGSSDLMLYGLLLAAAVGYFVYKKRKG